MPKKRKSGGKSGSSKGNYGKVQCTKCGRFVARSKAKAVTRRTSLVDGRMYTELKKLIEEKSFIFTANDIK